jgi:hypothetical protein
MPLKESECGLPTVLSLTVSTPVRGPNWLGVKVTLIVQFAAGATLVPHVFCWPKSELLVPLVPVAAMLVIPTGELPVLVRVAACVALVFPTS